MWSYGNYQTYWWEYRMQRKMARSVVLPRHCTCIKPLVAKLPHGLKRNGSLLIWGTRRKMEDNFHHSGYFPTPDSYAMRIIQRIILDLLSQVLKLKAASVCDSTTHLANDCVTTGKCTECDHITLCYVSRPRSSSQGTTFWRSSLSVIPHLNHIPSPCC